MTPIGASATWKWVPYTNAYVTGHDLLVVWRWSAQSAEGFRRIVDAITN